MKYMPIGQSDVQASQLALGCMRMAEKSVEEAQQVITTVYDQGINFFDHADIYGKGQSEVIFAKAMKAAGLKREDLYLQSKCGIRSGFFDFSKQHILDSVDGILERLETDYLDFLLLHRPDALMEPEEVAEAFTKLKTEGKVRYFGVSNQNSNQIALLQAYLNQPLVANQLQYGPAHTPMLDAGLNVNMLNEASVMHDGGTIEYCRLHQLTIQPWSPFQVDLGQGLFNQHAQFVELTDKINQMAKEKNSTFEGIVTAWILRHPAKMQPIVGSMNSDRIKRMVQGTQVQLTRQEWYDIYRSAGHQLP